MLYIMTEQVRVIICDKKLNALEEYDIKSGQVLYKKRDSSTTLSFKIYLNEDHHLVKAKVLKVWSEQTEKTITEIRESVKTKFFKVVTVYEEDIREFSRPLSIQDEQFVKILKKNKKRFKARNPNASKKQIQWQAWRQTQYYTPWGKDVASLEKPTSSNFYIRTNRAKEKIEASRERIEKFQKLDEYKERPLTKIENIFLGYLNEVLDSNRVLAKQAIAKHRLPQKTEWQKFKAEIADIKALQDSILKKDNKSKNVG